MYSRSWKVDILMVVLHRVAGASPREVFVRSCQHVRAMCGAPDAVSDKPPSRSFTTRRWTRVQGKLLPRISFLWVVRWLIVLADQCVTDYSGDDITQIYEKLTAGVEPSGRDWIALREAFVWADWYLWWDSKGSMWWSSYPVYSLEQDGEFDKAGELLWRKSKRKDAYDGTLQHAVSCFQKAGKPEKARQCCEELYRRFGVGYSGLDRECVTALHNMGELEAFCCSVKELSDQSSRCLWGLAEETAALKRYDLAAELCVASWSQGRNPSCLHNAIEWSKKADRSTEEIRELYEAVYLASKSTDPFLTEPPLANSLRWLWKNGQLETFVANVATHNAGPVWNELDDLIEFEGKEADNKEDYTFVARLMLRCYETAENCDKPFSWLGGQISKSHVMHRSAECYEAVGRLKDAADLYIRLRDKGNAAKCLEKDGQCERAAALWEEGGAHEQAAYAYEGAGCLEDAIRCYTKAAGEQDYGRPRVFRELAAMLRERLRTGGGVHTGTSKESRPLPKIGGEWQIACHELHLQDTLWTTEGVLRKEKEVSTCPEFDAVGKLCESLGIVDRAAALYRAAGRESKAQRLSGGTTYQVEETLECFRGLQQRRLLSSPLAQAYWDLGDRWAAVHTCLDFDAEGEAHELAERASWGSWNQDFPGGFEPLQPVLDVHKRLGDNERVREVRKELSEAKRWARQHMRQFLDEDEQSITDPGAARHFDSYRLDQVTRNHVKVGDYEIARFCIKEIIKLGKRYDDVPPEDWCLFQLSVVAYLEGNFPDAFSLLAERGRLADDHLGFKALVYLRLGAHSAAATCFVRKIAQDYAASPQKALASASGSLRTVADLCRLDGNRKEELKALRLAETMDRRMGIWAPVARYYVDRQFLAEMERVCREEGELDVAVYLYEKQCMSEDAVRIHRELSGQT